MIDDSEWIDSLENGGIEDKYTQTRKEIIKGFVDYSESWL